MIHASDPLSLAGARAELRQQPAVELVEAAGGESGAVALLLAEAVDELTLAHVRRLVRVDGMRTVLVTGAIREGELLQVVESGVSAIVRRQEATGPRLLEAVLAASRGEGALPSDLLGRLLSQVGALRRNTPGHPAGLTAAGVSARELDVVRLVAEGLDTGEIATKLSYSERTVKNVMHGLTTRLHLRNRAHAVAHAFREGYL